MREGLNRAERFDENTLDPFDQAVALAENARDADAISRVASTLEAHVAEMRNSPAALSDSDGNYRGWISLFEDEAARYRRLAREIDPEQPSGPSPTNNTDEASDPSAPERGGAESLTGLPADTDSDAALVIARERYARGEIDRDQFLQLKEDLSS